MVAFGLSVGYLWVSPRQTDIGFFNREADRGMGGHQPIDCQCCIQKILRHSDGGDPKQNFTDYHVYTQAGEGR